VVLKEVEKPCGEVTLHCREAGQGRSLIFLHGITANAMVWEPVLLELAKDFHVISADQRGHGRSSKPAAGYAALNFASDVLGLVGSFPDRQAIVVGHSLGARNAIVSAALGGGRILGAVAIDFTPFIETEVFDALDARVNGGARQFSTIDEICSYLADRYPLLPKDAIQRRAQYGYMQNETGRFSPLANPAAMSAISKGLRENYEWAFNNLPCPALLIRGEVSKLVSPEAFAKTLKHWPDLPWRTIPGADHYVPEEAPKEMVQTIREILTSI